MLIIYIIHVITFRANEKLVQVNQAFHDVLNKDESKKLYDQLCRFREVRKRQIVYVAVILNW